MKPSVAEEVLKGQLSWASTSTCLDLALGRDGKLQG